MVHYILRKTSWTTKPILDTVFNNCSQTAPSGSLKLDKHVHDSRNSQVDRRVARTRHALQQAFLQLIVDKGYDETSIQDICEAANVGRSTFYLHYSSKDELKRAGLDHLRRALLGHGEKSEVAKAGRAVPLAFSRAFFEHAQAHASVYKAMAGSGGGSLALETIREILTGLIKEDRFLPADIRGNRIALSIIAGAFMEVLTAWLGGGASEKAGDIDASFRHYVLGGVAPGAAKE